jgi:uncharacterized protein
MPTPGMREIEMDDVPLFPLPNVVLFPRAVLPLHIFEPRYRTMMHDTLAGGRQIAMALLRGDWKTNYHGAPEIYDVVCVGTILSHEKLPDGRYNLMLEGTTRARIVSEDRTRPYRRARLSPIIGPSVFEIDLAAEREALVDVLNGPDLLSTTLGRQISRLLDGPVSTLDIADICAFHLLDDLHLKQQLLGEADGVRRVRRIVHALRAARASELDELSERAKLN